jgi:haloalkane dehalogenase
MLEAREALSRWKKPTLVAFSDSDPIFPAASGEKWAERIPGAVGFELIEGASHFLQEDKGEEVASAIVRFLAST